ncbi:hypothetical protein [Streptomyces sp. NWU339]|uniref:hypothetical protein n=1 Tax=Streptomyces sp. NWU339 TaxID=2185284 RepID=UPI0011B5CBB3|nr:hypothetical protein [Streptomyces sp. NWU339]
MPEEKKSVQPTARAKNDERQRNKRFQARYRAGQCRSEAPESFSRQLDRHSREEQWMEGAEIWGYLGSVSRCPIWAHSFMPFPHLLFDHSAAELISYWLDDRG